jgi:lipopolysaccharide export system protein LptA
MFSRLSSLMMCLAAGTCCMALPLAAEQADRNLPIEIRALDVTIDQVNRTYELRGNATLTQGTMRLVAERMIVKEDDQGNRTAQLYGTTGKPVTFRQKREGSNEFMEGFADRAEFDDASDVLQLFSNARLKNGTDELRGEYIYYNSATEVLKASGQVPGGKPNTSESGQDVYFSLMPRNADRNAAATKPQRNK